MKLGIPALVHEIENAICICKRNDYIKHIEIGIDNLHECKKILHYKKEFEENNISIGIHLPMELNSCENVEYIRNSWISFVLEIDRQLKDLDIKYFNLHLGYAIKNRFEKNKEKYLDNSINFLKLLNLNKDILIENTYTNGGDICNIGTTVREFEYIFNKINNIGFCYDTGHDLISPDCFTLNLKHKLKLIHLSDNDGKKDLHIGIGKGVLNLDKLKETFLLNAKYIVLEIKYEDIEESIKMIERFI